jgi:hypothetical protein
VEKPKPQGVLIELSATKLFAQLPPLDEANLARMFRHWTQHGFAGLTAWRHKKPLAENRTNLDKLKRQVFAAGYGFIPVLGRYEEEGMPEPVWEPSLLVPAVKRGAAESSWPHLRKLIILWGQTYDQDSVLLAHPSEDMTPTAELIQTRKGDGIQEPRRNDSTIVLRFARFRVGSHFIATSTTAGVGRAMHGELERGQREPSVKPAQVPGRTFGLTGEARLNIPLGGGVGVYGRRGTGEVLPYSTPASYPR